MADLGGDAAREGRHARIPVAGPRPKGARPGSVDGDQGSSGSVSAEGSGGSGVSSSNRLSMISSWTERLGKSTCTTRLPKASSSSRNAMGSGATTSVRVRMR